MPRETFLNLRAEKRNQITEAFLREFSLKTYDETSLSEVVRELGIAKGSIYQYFDGKMDLFMYLIQECAAVKMSYVGSVKRENFSDYWAFFRALYDYGFQFDEEKPLHSHFLHNLVNNLNSPSVKALCQDMLKQTVAAFEEMVSAEMDSGKFRQDLPVSTMGFVLYKMGMSIREFLELSETISPKESIEKNLPVYQGKKEVLMQVVDDYIQLIRPAFDK